MLRQSREDVDVGVDGIRGASRILVAAGSIAQAEEFIRGCTEIFPGSMSIFVDMGELLAKTGEKQKAITAYLRARECLPLDRTDAESKAWWAKEIERRLGELGWPEVAH